MADTQRYSTGAEPQIILHHVNGDLTINGWMNEEVEVDSSDAVVDNQTGKGNALEIRCNDDCRLQVPRGASVHVLAIGGDGKLDGVQGAVVLDQVSGDLQLLRVGNGSIGQVNGDLSVRHVDGGLTVKGVNGDAKALHINGDVELERVNGDLRLHIVGRTMVGQVGGDMAARQVGGDLHVDSVGGDANIHHVEGSLLASTIGDDLTLVDPLGNVQVTVGDDASLRLDPQPGANYVVFAGSDATCRIPPESNASITLRAGGEVDIHRLSVEVPLEVDENQQQRSFMLGNGDAQIAVTAGGDISLIGSEMNWDEGSGIDIGMEIGLRAGELAQQVASQVDRKLSELANNDDLMLSIQDKVQSAMSMAETKISEAMRQAEQSIKEAEARSAQAEAERKRQQQRWRVNKPAKPAKPSAPQVSDEERLIILRMVDDGKISVEQAEQLLAALRPKAQG